MQFETLGFVARLEELSLTETRSINGSVESVQKGESI